MLFRSVTYMFNNHHDNGKQCLIAATFSKRFGQVLYNVYPVCQEIKPDGIPQEWIAAEHTPAVVDGVGCFSLVGDVYKRQVNNTIKIFFML